MNTLVHFIMDESGASAFEYGLIAAAASLAVSAVIPLLKNT